MKAVVLCAGYGTRLGQLTQEIPKPMLPVNGKPLLEYLLIHLEKHGFRQVAINLHFMPERIRGHFGTGANLGLKITYFHELALLGTAGALRNMAGWLSGEKDFLVQYGDVVTDQDFTSLLAFHREKQSELTFLLHQRAKSNSVVRLDSKGRITGFLERPSEEMRKTLDGSWVNSGISICDRDVLGWIPETAPSDIPRDLAVPRVESNRIYGYPLSAFRCAIDSPERYAQAEQALREGKCYSAS